MSKLFVVSGDLSPILTDEALNAMPHLNSTDEALNAMPYLNSRFFEQSAYKQREKPVRQTMVFESEMSEDGTTKLVEKSVESCLAPLSSLRFDDFSIQTLIKSGINPKSLAISPDLRLGHDAEIEAFNSRLESLSSEMFNVQN